MGDEHPPAVTAVANYLHSRPRWVRWREWGMGRRYLVACFQERPRPLVIVAHSFRDASKARQVALAIEQDWAQLPVQCRASYDEILLKAPGILVLQLRRTNVCGCLGHRHPVVREAPFAEPHEAFGGASVGEMDIAYERVETWLALPLTDTALDARFLAGSRLEEFHARRLRLRLLSILLHETHHLVAPQAPEASVRERSLAFYREAVSNYVENTLATLSFTIDRSFSRLG